MKKCNAIDKKRIEETNAFYRTAVWEEERNELVKARDEAFAEIQKIECERKEEMKRSEETCLKLKQQCEDFKKTVEESFVFKIRQ